MTTRVATLCGLVRILVGLLLGTFCAAASPTVAQTEVEYLLGAVASSGCEFFRNGEWFDSGMASAHLRDKYNALAEVGRIATAMDFIEEAATESSLTGRPYLMRCAGAQPVPTDQWLQEVLQRYRRGASLSTPCAPWLPHDAQGINHSMPNRPVSRLS